MKKVTISADQFDLSKEVVANLSDEQLQAIEGGVGAQDDPSSCKHTSGSGSSCRTAGTEEAGQ